MQWPNLPSIFQLILTILALVLGMYFNISTWISAALLAFIWAGSVGHWYSSWQLPNRYFNQNLIIEGTIASIHIQQDKLSQINSPKNTEVYQARQIHDTHSNKQKVLVVKVRQLGKYNLFHEPKVRLSWFAPTLLLQQGNEVRLLVKIKPPHGLANEFGFNRQSWLASQNIVALGNIKPSPSNRVLNRSITLRQKIANRIIEYAEKLKLNNVRWMLALSLGERNLLTTQDWTLLQETGTAHLFAISGLHLGIVSLLFYNFTKMLVLPIAYLVRRKKLQGNLIPVALLVTLPFCLFYAHISGFQVPVLRATLAILLLTYLTIFQVYWRLLAIVLNLLLCFLVLFPLSTLSISFWFSFSAVFAIWYYVWRFPLTATAPLQTLKHTLGLQLFLSLTMLPLVAFNFAVVSIISPLVNIIVLPIVSMIMVPLSLLLVLSLMFDTHFLITQLFTCLDWMFGKLLLFMQALQSAPYATMEIADINFAQSGLVVLFLVLVFLPCWPNRLKLILMLALSIGIYLVYNTYFAPPISANAHVLVHKPEHQSSPNWSLRVFDIGQGLSVLIRQGNEHLLYDTGPSFMGGSSLAPVVLKPYFDATKPSRERVASIEYLVNSHMDNDHSGGNNFIFNQYDVKTWLSPASGCTVNDSFIWGALSLTILSPLINSRGDENNDSCVIKISDGTHSVLLTGDIEEEIETKLIKHYSHSGMLKADVLLAPHHGSKTSSTLPFVRAVAPKYIAISSQYYNQWGFPHESVLRHYKEINAEVFNTAYDGEVIFTFYSGGIRANAYRRRWSSPWYMAIP